ncbi:hypothetical protein DFQ26_002482 [Actinomortierella ambigua]|nr:hypothetical protein DFQ26_002482 [Actinomortierella ambigua]
MSQSSQKLEVDELYQKAEKMEDGSVISDFDPNSLEIRRVRRKADLHLIPIFSLLYLFSFIDRVNIGNAKVAGIEKSLGITSNQFNMALTVFFIGYILFEIPSNVMLKLLGPKIWISLVIVVWGGIMMAMAAANNAGSLMAARFFLGVAEAGLLPGVIYMISVWYTKREMALRNGLFFSMASFAGAFSGILAYGISKLHGKANLEGWQWIFLLEGLFTICLVPLAYFGLPQSPATAWFLTQAERELQVARLRRDAGPAKEEHFSWTQFRMAVTDWQVYMYIIGYFMGSAPLFALSLFIPSIVLSFKYDPLITQLMSNFGGHTKKAVAIGLIVSVGCIGGVLGSFIYRAEDAPLYTRGHTISAALTFVAGCASFVLRFLYIRENRRRDRLSPEERARAAEGEELCDRHPDFRYSY